jgi:hypothetical protein
MMATTAAAAVYAAATAGVGNVTTCGEHIQWVLD